MQAQEFKTYLKENPYFLSIVNELQDENKQAILDLNPNNKDMFTFLQATRLGIGLPLSRVDQDIIMGNDASNRLEGRPIEGGIL